MADSLPLQDKERLIGRQLAKVAHSNPIVVFNAILKRFVGVIHFCFNGAAFLVMLLPSAAQFAREAYVRCVFWAECRSRDIGDCLHGLFFHVRLEYAGFENQIKPVVDSFRYLSQLAYDVLVFTMIDRLGRTEGRNAKLKDDGQSIAKWFDNLAKFCGATKPPIVLFGTPERLVQIFHFYYFLVLIV